jgi:hypothetical protein
MLSIAMLQVGSVFEQSTGLERKGASTVPEPCREGVPKKSMLTDATPTEGMFGVPTVRP